MKRVTHVPIIQRSLPRSFSGVFSCGTLADSIFWCLALPSPVWSLACAPPASSSREADLLAQWLRLTYRMPGRVKETLHISRSITWTSTFPQQKNMISGMFLTHLVQTLLFTQSFLFSLQMVVKHMVCALPASSQRVHGLPAWLLQSCFSVYLTLRLMLTQVRHGNVTNLQCVTLSLSRTLFHPSNK